MVTKITDVKLIVLFFYSQKLLQFEKVFFFFAEQSLIFCNDYCFSIGQQLRTIYSYSLKGPCHKSFDPLHFSHTNWAFSQESQLGCCCQHRERILRRGALACTWSRLCGWSYLIQFSFRNLSNSPCSEPSCTVLLPDVMYTMYARHPS